MVDLQSLIHNHNGHSIFSQDLAHRNGEKREERKNPSSPRARIEREMAKRGAAAPKNAQEPEYLAWAQKIFEQAPLVACISAGISR